MFFGDKAMMHSRWSGLAIAFLVGTFALSAVLPSSAPAQRPGSKRPAQKRPKPPKINLPFQDPPPKVDLKIAPVDPATKREVMASAAKIDALIEAKLTEAGQKPNPPASDAQFMRRAYLDITGTIPTGREAYQFLKSTNEYKRIILIDYLMNKPGYASHSFNYWADILRVVDKPNNNTPIRAWGDWLKEGLRENRPYDEIVREMMTAEGKPWENPAVGYKLRDQGMPLDNLNNTVRIFLGTQIGCAQCHDHPFDRWTQKEFYELAAFESSVLTRSYGPGSKFAMLEKAVATASDDRQMVNKLKQIERMNRSEVVVNGRRQLRFPHDYAYDDVKPGDLVKPNPIFGQSKTPANPAERREEFAKWLTSKDNPRFALTIANRLWKRNFGLGVIEPVDEMKDDTVASNPELMAFLVAEMKRLNFDMKEFQRIIYHTKAYQNQVTYEEIDLNKPYYFPGPILRRMTAEQVWDSLITLTVPYPDAYLRPDDKPWFDAINAKPDASVDELQSKVAKMIEHEKATRLIDRTQSYKSNVLRRASELPQPLPDGHFLREFGQSDRGVISGGVTDGSVPQLLTLFNGPVTHMMLENGSLMVKEVMAADGKDNHVRIIFLSVLGRTPSPEETRLAMAEIRENEAMGYGNVLWALLNTREFLFIQ